ncbi:MAG: AarF/ABC1/UbiB kinase family protein [Chloroflexi bacterium]|nr:AarF/ABC1/UbiB kinase family protein [Chloroflexota bacterium]
MPLKPVADAFSRAARTATVVRTAFVVYRSYKRTQRAVAGLTPEARDAEWARRHAEAAQRVVHTAKRLRGLYIKSAQYLGARADLLPEQYIAELSQLHDRVPPQPYASIRPVLRTALGAEPEDVFARFERRPIGAASLAQVHRATLKDGREVAVKVQYPDIGRLVRLDLRNLTTILRLVHRVEKNINLLPVAQAVGRLVPQELDFVNEGRSAERIAAGLAHRADVRVPAVVWEHSSRQVLVTEFVEGIKVSDVERLRAHGHNTRAIAARVADVWGEQVLQLGHFHGDPHPGNILVLPDGTLGLIDFGLTAHLAPEARDSIAAMCRASAARNPIGVFAAFRSLGFIAPGDSPAAYVGLAGRVMAPDGDTETVNTRMARALHGFDIATVPAEALLVMRVLGLLAGLTSRLGGSGPVLPSWLPYAGERELAAGA